MLKNVIRNREDCDPIADNMQADFLALQDLGSGARTLEKFEEIELARLEKRA